MENPDSSWVPPSSAVALSERLRESAASGAVVIGGATGTSASSSVSGSAAGAATLGNPGEQCARNSSRGVVWVSIDPRVGTINVYPRAVAERLEAEHERHGPLVRVSVPLAGCGGFFEGASVDFGGGEPPTQKTTRGKRDVRRVEVPAGASRINFNVVFSRAWRIADEAQPGITQERYAEVSRDSIVCVDGGDDSSAADERSQAVKAGDAAGLVSLWEWSRLPELEASASWGLYGEEQGSLIENAFREGKRSVEVSVGIRNYEVVFEGSEGGKQVDRALHKRRLVRRRLVAPNRRDAELRAAAEAVAETAGDAEGECAVCFADFVETPTMPIARLVECGHLFHCACVQEIADKGDPCPLCRGAVDWKKALKVR